MTPKEKSYKERISYLEKLVKKQCKAIDKALADQKILRGYLENPHQVAECAVIARSYYDDMDSAYMGGYEKALNEIKRSLGITGWMTESEMVEFLDRIL